MKRTLPLENRSFYRVAGMLLCLLPMPGACTDEGLPILGDLPFNFHPVEEGRVYRSGQPTGDQLFAAIEQLGLKTVVNLRGENVGKSWYDTEAAVCESMNVTLANHAMSAGSLPSPELLAAILHTLETAEYPVLIHCQSGADRTGAISAIYRMRFLGHEKADALAELSPLYLHFRNRYPCMDTLAEAYEPTDEWLAGYPDLLNDLVCTP